MKTVLFDLDGTLINSKLGITRCTQYALKAFGVEEEDLDKLECFIGPPLDESFCKYYGFSEEQSKEAVVKYRERYHPIGIYECELYPGVKELLERLRALGYQIAMASSKPEESCRTIMQHFHLTEYFDEIVGATMDGRICSKISVLREVMRRLAITDMQKVILVGDTRFDVLGAKEAGMDCIGVTYGFGSKEELMETGAVTICESVKEVGDYIAEEF